MSVLLLLAACATTGRMRAALAEKTDQLIIGKSCNDTWPTVKQVLEDWRFPGFPKGERQFHLETAMLTASGSPPGAETTGGTPPMRGMQRGAGGMRSGPVDHSGSAVLRYVVDGDVVDDGHCRVRVVRHKRDNIDSAESDIERDGEMEFEIVSRLEPDRANAIRKELADQGIELQR